MLGGQGADFLRAVAFWSIRSSGLLRWFCVTGAALRGRRSTLDRWSGKIAKRIGTRPSALHSTFHFLKDVSQNCFVFDVVNFEKWGSLAESLCFWRYQVQKLRTSRWIAAFLMFCQVQELRKSRRIASFSSLQIEIDRQTDRQIDR